MKSLALTFSTLAIAGMALTGCAATSSPSESASPSQAASVSFTDGWVKSAAADGMGMTALFGTLHNAGSASANLVSAECGDLAGTVELHQTTTDSAGNSSMSEIDGGFVLPAGASFELAPGGNHIMLMGLTGALTAGDEMSCVVSFADSSTMRLTVPVKDFSGANETYSGDTATESPMNMG